MAFPESFLDDLIARSDITEVVADYVQLIRRSGSNLFGLCPFHNEKTPSFCVSSDKQMYHCFGCGKGGGVINFVMEIESLSYPDAVQFLAKRAGIAVPDDGTSEDVRNRRARLLDLNRDAARFYFDVLSAPEGAAAVEYIGRRAISRSMVKKFGLGAAPDSWSRLLDAMTTKGYGTEELFDAGLIKRGSKGKGFYDTFRNRLMFPVIDVRGSVVGFSGRALGDNEPKYLNSPDTPVYSKSRCLFALNLAKKTKSGMLILTEGNIDVVSLHQAGFDGAVASLGTSLTPEQARLMSRYTEKVVIAYDSDSAGVKASQRAIAILEKAGLHVRVLQLNGAKDPDEFIKSSGAGAFKKLLDQSENSIDYRLLQIKNKYSLDTDSEKVSFLAEAADMLSHLESAVEREIYGGRVAELVGVSQDAVKNEIRTAYKKNMASKKKKQEAEVSRPSLRLQPADRNIKYNNVVSAAAEEGVIRLLLLDPSLSSETGRLTAEDFSSAFLAKAYEIIKRRIESGGEISPASLTAELLPSEAAHLSVIIQRPEKLPDGKTVIADYINKILTERLKSDTKNDLIAISQRYKEKKGYGG